MLSAELRLLSIAWCPNCPSSSFVRYGAVVVLGGDAAAVLGCVGMLLSWLPVPRWEMQVRY